MRPVVILRSIAIGLQRIFFIILVPTLLIAGGIVWVVNPLEWGRPSDKALITLFQTHENDFEQLRLLAQRDIGKKSFVSEKLLGCSDTRNSCDKEYCELIGKIRGDLRVFIDSDRITFTYSYGGCTICRSWMKGVAYLPNGPERVGEVESDLDNPPSQDDVYLRPIKGNWFVVYARLD
jgi:hypothetical protein